MTATTTPENNDLIGWMRENNHAARVARTFVEFSDLRSLPNDDVNFPN